MVQHLRQQVPAAKGINIESRWGLKEPLAACALVSRPPDRAGSGLARRRFRTELRHWPTDDSRVTLSAQSFEPAEPMSKPRRRLGRCPAFAVKLSYGHVDFEDLGFHQSCRPKRYSRSTGYGAREGLCR